MNDKNEAQQDAIDGRVATELADARLKLAHANAEGAIMRTALENLLDIAENAGIGHSYIANQVRAIVRPALEPKERVAIAEDMTVPASVGFFWERQARELRAENKRLLDHLEKEPRLGLAVVQLTLQVSELEEELAMARQGKLSENTLHLLARAEAALEMHAAETSARNGGPPVLWENLRNDLRNAIGIKRIGLAGTKK